LFNGKRDFVPNLYSFFIFLSTVTIVSFLFPPCATCKILVISKPNPLPVGNPTNSPRKVWVRNNGDPRRYSRFNKESRLNNSSNNNYNNSAADEEARKYAMSTSSRIVDYIERIYQV
jgi:hypothetical protein